MTKTHRDQTDRGADIGQVVEKGRDPRPVPPPELAKTGVDFPLCLELRQMLFGLGGDIVVCRKRYPLRRLNLSKIEYLGDEQKDVSEITGFPNGGVLGFRTRRYLAKTGLRANFRIARQLSMIAFNRDEIGGLPEHPGFARSPIRQA